MFYSESDNAVSIVLWPIDLLLFIYMVVLWLQVLIPLSTSGSKVEENSHLPDYLPEDESPEKELDRAVSRTGAKQDTGGSWLNTAASFLTKTFYW